VRQRRLPYAAQAKEYDRVVERGPQSALERAAVLVEDRYSAVFKLDHARPSTIAEGLGEAAARFPTVPIVFAETRPLAQEWTYRFLGAALAHHHDHQLGSVRRVTPRVAGRARGGRRRGRCAHRG
jgi:hypothetical protein